MALFVGRSTNVGAGLSHDSLRKKPVLPPFIPAVIGFVPIVIRPSEHDRVKMFL